MNASERDRAIQTADDADDVDIRRDGLAPTGGGVTSLEQRCSREQVDDPPTVDDHPVADRESRHRQCEAVLARVVLGSHQHSGAVMAKDTSGSTGGVLGQERFPSWCPTECGQRWG